MLRFVPPCRAILACLFYGSVLAAPMATPAFTLTGPGLVQGGRLPNAQVFSGFGCTGGDRSPALSWSTPPAGTKSLAVTAYDPDAPTGSGWWHWTVFNLPPTTSGLPESAGAPSAGSLPAGAVQGRTDYGQPGFGGACPPAGDAPHHYVFTVWALNTDHLPLDASASGAMVGVFLHQHAIGSAALTLRYGR